MQTTITQVTPVEYELEITAKAEDLAPEIEQALRAQRARTQMKGFRPGKVPMPLVKKLHGRAIAYEVADRAVQRLYQEEVVESDEHDVLGQPEITELDYDLDQDLRAVIRFGVRPEVELQDLSGATVMKLVHPIEDEDVDKEIDRLRQEHADLIPLEDEGLGEADYAVVDLQQIDEASGTPIIGEKEEDVSFFLDDDRLQDELKDGLLGKKAGDTFQVSLPHGEGEHQHTHRYEVTVKETKRRDLPELDDAFVKEVSSDKFEDVDSFRAEIRRQLEEGWTKRGDELMSEQIVEKMLDLHEVPVPTSVVEMYLDSFVEDLKKRMQNELPQGFNEAAFRQANRPDAEKQARWMLLRDQVIAHYDLEVTDEDRDAHFKEVAGENEELSTDVLQQYYRSVPGLMDQLEQRLLSEKVFATLREQFQHEEVDRETFEERARAEREARSAATVATPPVTEPAAADEPAADEAPAEPAAGDEEEGETTA